MADSTRAKWPRWLRELDLALATRPQMVVSGNLRDTCFVSSLDGTTERTILEAIGDLLHDRQAAVLQWDPLGGIFIDPPDAYANIRRYLPKNLQKGEAPPAEIDANTFVAWMEALVVARDLPLAIVIDYSSRIARDPNELDEDQQKFFLRCLKLSHKALELRRPSPSAAPRYNPVIWISDRVQDLPPWLLVGNSRIRQISVPLPDYDTRHMAAKVTIPHFPNGSRFSERQLENSAKELAEQTEGMPLRAIKDIRALSSRYDLSASSIVESVRRYRVGLPDNPWNQSYLHDRVAQARATLSNYVMGQDKAIDSATAILTRAFMGLSGAQSANNLTRPRGVMFLAGPTGVGKTELAKSITRLLFNDEKACVRFDMSEFGSEHAEARLIGAPPGYVGYDAGGELVNAVRQRPFSVLLFDEIEKAHPRILDKFLQILEDGRLTDGHGETAYFSECLLVFTSNLGIYSEVNGSRVLNVSPDDPAEEVRARILSAIQDHFRREMNRPELLNRMGGNIIVFDFIRPDVARRIAKNMIDVICNRVRSVHGITIEISEHVWQELIQLVTDDPANGGRGVGNRLETLFINPLSTALFHHNRPHGSTVMVSALTEINGIPGIELS